MNVRILTVTAVCIAIVFVLVRVVQIPIPATGGYWHPGAVAEIFVALAFGPVVGMVAAGVGAAIADLTSFPVWAPLTLVAHGLLGLLAGWLAWKKDLLASLAGWIAGGLALVAVYFAGQATVYGLGLANALAELPLNLFQVGLGLLGILLFQLVKRAYPQIEGLASRPKFEEE